MEDVEEMHRKSVDPITGRIFMKQTLQTDLRKRQQTVKAKFEENFADIEGKKELEGQEEEEDDLVRETLREMAIDVDKILPNRELRTWLAA